MWCDEALDRAQAHEPDATSLADHARRFAEWMGTNKNVQDQYAKWFVSQNLTGTWAQAIPHQEAWKQFSQRIV